ncbi:hypothetical protein SAMN05421774_11240 [Gemmobacter megaterium]|uniref:Uncharacterized protein n=1 Tax=Gemmobacter megaterium TaxID=1086013 RepID=A0A1N7QII1_9RHOB|nr:hypothetical protein [Gemmobacter megaterium]GGE26711.1 hypothetical protein GCM10011345_35880 [Gemmobacter megaterium]SIT22675.1 hypothetical protein SAMN05421774_11240 [Gemmobacter megaterium]
MTAPRLKPVPNDLPEYPVARGVRLDGHSFVKWQHLRWLSSRSFRLCSWEVQGMARALFDLSQLESPVGTLPDDDAELAQMLRVDARRMAELRRMEFGPLRNWCPCLSDGEVRLMHPVVLAQVQDAIERREIHELSKEDKATYQRLKRLREALRGMGLSEHVLADDRLIGRMDDWLKQGCKGNRRATHYEAALMHAVAQGWCEGPMRGR